MIKFLLFFCLFVLEAASATLSLEDSVWVHYTQIRPGFMGDKAHLVPGSVMSFADAKEATTLISEVDRKEMEACLMRGQSNMQRRATLHGVLNGVVAPHLMRTQDTETRTLDRAHYAYAVMVPFPLLDQMAIVLDAHPQDTYVLGRVPLKDAVVLAIHGADVPDVAASQVIQLGAGVNIFDGVKQQLKSSGKPFLGYREEDQKIKMTRAFLSGHFLNMTDAQYACCLGKGAMTTALAQKLKRHRPSLEATIQHNQGAEIFLAPDDRLLSLNGGALQHLGDVMPAHKKKYACWTHEDSVFRKCEQAVSDGPVMDLVTGIIDALGRDDRPYVEKAMTMGTKIPLSKMEAEEKAIQAAVKAGQAEVTARYQSGKLSKEAMDFFGAYAKELKVWVTYVLKEEITRRKKRKPSLFVPSTAEGVDDIVARVPRVQRTIKKMRNPTRDAQKA